MLIVQYCMHLQKLLVLTAQQSFKPSKLRDIESAEDAQTTSTYTEKTGNMGKTKQNRSRWQQVGTVRGCEGLSESLTELILVPPRTLYPPGLLVGRVTTEADD